MVKDKKEVADPADLERCLRQIRTELAKDLKGKRKVICTLTWRGAIDAVAAELSYEERKRVVFRVTA